MFNPTALRTGRLGRQLIGGAISGASFQFVGMGLRLANQAILAWLLGPAGLGLYALSLSIALLASIPAGAGLPLFLVRDLSSAHARSDFGIMRGLLYFANTFVLASSLIVILVGMLLLHLYKNLSGGEPDLPVLAGLLLVPILSLNAIRSAALMALRRFHAAQCLTQVVEPAAMLAVVGAAYIWFPERINPHGALIFYAMAVGLSCVIGSFVLYRAVSKVVSAATPLYHVRAWLLGILPLSLNAVSGTVNNVLGPLVLGAFSTPEAVGLFRIAQSGAHLATFGTTVLNGILRPEVSRLWGSGDTRRLARLLTLAARAAFLVAFTTSVIFAVFGEQLIAAIYGEAFGGAAMPLVLLSVGITFASLLGFPAVLLEMTRYAPTLTKVMTALVLGNIVSTVVLTYGYGLEGTAIAAAGFFVIQHLALGAVAQRRTKVLATAFSSYGWTRAT